MATYALGDVQGCYEELQALLARVGFERGRDRLWFVGDLVNRGPKSLEVLRFVRSLGEDAIVVLGNHDLHLLAAAEGVARARKEDTFGDVLAAPDRNELLDWLRGRSMMHAEGRYALVHAGLLPQWSVLEALRLARALEAVLRSASYREFLTRMYGARPARWDERLEGHDRLRAIVNAMTRLRFCTAEGAVDFHVKSEQAPAGYLPWFEARPVRDEPAIVCGHWSALGLKLSERFALLDSGCVWGGALSALRLEDRWLAQVPCSGYQTIGEEA